MSSSMWPTALTLTELENLPIGQQYLGTGCVPAITGTGSGSAFAYATAAGFSWPNNGEFVWTGDGPINGCSYCSLQAGHSAADGCPGGSIPFAGTVPAITRVAYNGDVTACCLGDGAKTQNGSTCDPSTLMGPASTACDGAFASYCATGNLSMSDPRCKTWGATSTANATTLYNLQKNVCASFPDANCSTALNNADYSVLLGNYLQANPTALNSSEWRNLALEFPGSANLSVQTYCADSNADPNFCSCINAANAVNGAFPPACISSQCNVYGYKTTADANNCTGNYTICNANLNAIAAQKVTMDNVTINQNCGNTASNTTTPSYVQKRATITAPTAAKTSNIFLFIIIFIVIIIVGGASYVIFFDNSLLAGLDM